MKSGFASTNNYASMNQRSINKDFVNMSISGRNLVSNRGRAGNVSMMMGSTKSNIAPLANSRRNKNTTIMNSELYPTDAEDFYVESDGPVKVKDDHFDTKNLKEMTNM